MRVTSSLFVAAHIRHCFASGAFALIERKGAEEAGAIFIRVDLADGACRLFVPAPQAAYDDARPDERMWQAYADGKALTRAEAEQRLRSEMKFDPDLWIVVIEDRQGRSFLPEDLLI